MKRGKKLFTLLLVLALILGATYAATLLNPENQDDTEIAYTTVFTINTDTVTNISWDYSEPLSFTKENDGWVYDADPTFPLDDDFIDTMLTSIEEIQSAKTIEQVEDWDQYALEVPICQVTVTADGTAHTIKLGEETSLGGERYLSIGDGNAYLVDADIMDAFHYGLYDVLKMESIPEMSDVYAMEHISDDSTYTIKRMENSGLAYTDDYVWFIDEKPLDTELTERLMSYVTAMVWKECVNYHADDLSKYGLDSPAATIVMHDMETVKVATNETDADGNIVYETQENEETYTLEIGASTDDGYYARIQGSNMIYTISTSAAETLLYTTYEELLPDEVLLMDWDTVNTIDIALDGETYEIQKGTTKITDDEGNESEEVVYKLNGMEVDTTSITDAIDGLESSGYATGLTPERNEEIRFVIKRDHDTFPEVELAIYQYNSTSCIITLNGETTVFVDRQSVVSLIEEVNALVLK